MAWLGLLVCICLDVCVRAAQAVPPQHRGWLRLWEEGEGCGVCHRQLCPPVHDGCPAGRVKDNCGCCEQCANAEGQQCDPDGAQRFYGSCGEGLVCQRKMMRRGRRGDEGVDPEPTCVCRDKGPVCGSNGWTYPNPCQLREAASRGRAMLELSGHGPCYSAPRIVRGPKDLSNYTGNDIVFGCEVSAYPLPRLTWRKKGRNYFLPGDDAHISVQTRGGPQRYTVSTWLQIEGLHLTDAGVYSCISHNAVGETSASAQLTVLRQAEETKKGRREEREKEDRSFGDPGEGSEHGQLESGDYWG
ncbi:kazal-type serine protease inhibitor domain-containing protein 1-like [Lampris incognitus]|uniref:kazal-type serine protease inhibitor domain-containing protein 1-like n=1 Tax=Lampris incognitus TaxID=2546036 RepID=UPI0024B4B360|nr:kazal-type serine protease inhibitor domain-containing protein 1-like [Lampris incognitus]